MKSDSGETIDEIRADGGAAANDLMMQFQSDLSAVRLVRSVNIETTALGAAYFAGLATGLWKIEELQEKWRIEKAFDSAGDPQRIQKLKSQWYKAVERTKNWID